MKTRINEQSGLSECVFAAKLQNVSDAIFENTNGTKYRVATISFRDKAGVTQNVTSMVYEKNFQQGMEVDKSYLTVATKTDQGVFVHTSHLAAAERADISMFDFEATVKATSEVNETAFEAAK